MFKFNSSKQTRPSYQVGLLQASGVTLYIALFVTTVNNSGRFFPSGQPNEVLSFMMFLIAFVTSALICSSLVLGYPVVLALKGKIREAIEIVAWSAAWMFVGLLLTLSVAITLR